MISIDVVGDDRSCETILAVHGGPGTDHRLFRPELDALGDFARLIYFDLPGHGRTPAPRDFSLETVAESLETVREAAGAPRITLLGSSYGGFVALAYALAHPSRVARLVLVDTAASSDFREQSIVIARERADHAMFAAFERLWSDALKDDEHFRHDWETLFPLYFARASREAVAAFASRTSYRLATRRAILPTMQHFDLRPRLAELRMAALVIVGAQDWITPPPQARELAAGLPNSRLVVFEDCGHYPFLEEPARFAAEVAAFFRATAKR